MNDRQPAALFPCGRAYVLGSDQRFVAAVAHELERMGLAAVSVTSRPFPWRDVAQDASLVVADLDDLTVAAWEELRIHITCPWILWSRQGMTVPHAVCLRRPFDLADFARVVKACVAEGDAPARSAAASVTEKADAVEVLREGVLSVQGREIALTPYEWAVYRCLRNHRGETVSRDTLQRVLDGAGGNTVDVYVCHLRAKLEKPLGVRLITTVRGQGYRME